TIKISDGAVTDAKIVSVSPSKISQDGATLNQVLKWDGSAWSPADDADTGGSAGSLDGFVSIDPSDFQSLKKNSNDLDRNQVILFQNDNTFVTIGDASKADKIIAPVHLPHNAIVEEVTIYFWDNNGNDISIDFFRKGFASANESLFPATWTSTGATASVRNETLTTINNSTIDNENYTYRIVVDFNFGTTVDTPGNAPQRIYGIKFKYTEPGNIVTGPGSYQSSFVGDSAPNLSDRYTGMVWIDTVTGNIRVWTGSAWNIVATKE
ncbi:hypothetical protein, partial [Fulvivirga aurantia]|uniref:hypothetical protein n=1 Tax=Fulvivirga aurantia TaxID=2529383 RepID=UPI00162A8786